MAHHITAVITKAATKAAALLCAGMLAVPLAAPLGAHAATTDTQAAAVSTQEITLAAGITDTASRILALQNVYPEGMPWTDAANTYVSAAWPFYGHGCSALAMQISDTIYGKNTKVSLLYGLTPDDIRVGDFVRINNSHSVIVTGVSADAITICEGNFNASVHWGRQISKSELAAQLSFIARRG